LGSKLYYEFTDEENWDIKITELSKAIGKHGKNGDAVVTPTVAEPPKNLTIVWTDADLHEWLKTNDIAHHFELFREHSFDRRALLEIQRVTSTNQTPFFPFFYNLFKELGITKYGDIVKVSAAIHNLK